MSYHLELNNFKTFDKFSLEIPASGIILLDGVSGRGKTTIIQAIVYAITGFGKKLATYGSKKVKVVMTKHNENNIPEFKITRTKSPEALMLEYQDKELHDDEAQSVINTLFGKNFINSSVLFQKGTMSFLSLTPKEKIQFIENILFSDFNIEEKKLKIKKIIKEKDEQLFSIRSKIDTLENIIKSKPSLTTSELYSELKTIQDCEDAKEDISKTYNNNKALLNIKSNELSTVLKILDQDAESISKKSSLFISINKLKNDFENTINELKDYNDIENIDTLKNRVAVLTNSIQRLNIHYEMIQEEMNVENISKKLSESLTEEVDGISKEVLEISGLNSALNSLEDEYETILEMISINNKISSVETKIQERLKYIEDDKYDIIEKYFSEATENLQKLHETKKQIQLSKTSIKCPCCDATLRYNSREHTLEPFNEIIEVDNNQTIEEIDDKINSTTKELEQLKNKMKMYQKVSESIELLKKEKEETKQQIKKEYDVDLNELKTKLSQIKFKIEVVTEQKNKVTFNRNRLKQLNEYIQQIRDKSHPMLKSHYEKIDKLKKDITNIKNYEHNTSKEDMEQDLSEVRAKLTYNSSEMIKKLKLNERKQNLYDEINELHQEYEYIVLLKEDLKNDYEIKSNSIRREMRDLQDYFDNTDLVKCINEIEKQMNYLKQREEIDNLSNQVIENKLIKDNLQNDTVMFSKLLKSIEVSESKLIYKFIDTLNQTLNRNLEAMFSEPMVISVNCFKNSKSSGEKPTIDLSLYYKGNETELGNLSGGEYDRVNLAFLLSFNELSNSDVLILDESLSSLDQELTSDIFEYLGEYLRANNKLVLTTLHQSIKGSFDSVISL